MLFVGAVESGCGEGPGTSLCGEDTAPAQVKTKPSLVLTCLNTLWNTNYRPGLFWALHPSAHVTLATLLQGEQGFLWMGP